MSKIQTIIGRSDVVSFPELGVKSVPARIDTGARTSSVWATGVSEKNGELEYVLFGKNSPLYTGAKHKTKQYELRAVASSTGHVQERYVVKILLEIGGRKIRASFTLANRSKQVYPVLIGRRVLSGKFLVDVKLGKSLTKAEVVRSKKLQSSIGQKG